MSHYFRAFILIMLMVALPLPVSAQTPIGSTPNPSGPLAPTAANGTTDRSSIPPSPIASASFKACRIKNMAWALTSASVPIPKPGSHRRTPFTTSTSSLQAWVTRAAANAPISIWRCPPTPRWRSMARIQVRCYYDGVALPAKMSAEPACFNL